MLVALFYISGRGTIRLRARDLLPKLGILIETTTIGLSAFVRQTSTSFVHGLRNNLLVLYGGTMFISAYGAVFRVILFLALPAMGIAQALPPIAGYNYGSGQMDRVRRALWVSICACTLFMWLGLAFTQIAPRLLLRMFSSDPALINQGVSIMRINTLVLLTFPAYFMGPSFYQAIGKSMRALIIALTRPVFSLIVMLIGVRHFGPLGIVAADPIAVAAGAAVAILLLRNTVTSTRAPLDALGGIHDIT